MTLKPAYSFKKPWHYYVLVNAHLTKQALYQHWVAVAWPWLDLWTDQISGLGRLVSLSSVGHCPDAARSMQLYSDRPPPCKWANCSIAVALKICNTFIILREFVRVAPDMIFSNLAGARFGRIWNCKSGRGRMFFELWAYVIQTAMKHKSKH